MAEPESGPPGDGGAGSPDTSAALLRELVAHLRQNRTVLREEWARRITEAQLLTALTPEEIFSEATSVYDNYVEVLETGSVEALQDYARNLSERIIPRGVETDEVLGIVLLLRDVLARSLFEKYQDDFNRVLDVYEPAANRIANTVAINFVQERERVIRQQQEAIRELSTPVLQVRERLLILPIIGVLDSQRARQLTEQLLRGDPRQPRQGRRDRHHRRADDRLDGGEPPRADRRGVAADGRERDHHRPLVGDRPDARHDRRRPVQGQRGRRPPGRHRGGRAAARLRGLDARPRPRRSRSAERGRRMAVPILKQGPFLIASIQAALTDTDVIRLQDDVMVQVGRFRSRGIVVDVTALDVMDSFVSRSLRGIAHMTRLRGAETVIVGIQPEVAFAMVQLGMNFEDVHTALDLEEGLAFLQQQLNGEPDAGGG